MDNIQRQLDALPEEGTVQEPTPGKSIVLWFLRLVRR